MTVLWSYMMVDYPLYRGPHSHLGLTSHLLCPDRDDVESLLLQPELVGLLGHPQLSRVGRLSETINSGSKAQPIPLSVEQFETR